MSTLPPERLRQLAREKALFRYSCALERGDFDTVASVLAEAENDAVLERLILELNDVLQAEVAQQPQLEEVRSETVLALIASAQSRPSPPGAASGTQERAATPPIMHSALNVPDDPHWRSDPAYSPAVAQALTAAYTHLRGSRHLGHFRLADECLRPLVGVQMAAWQRMSLCYVLAITSGAVSDYTQALRWLDDALSAATQVNSPSDLALLLFLRGGINRAISRLSRAAADFRDSLALVHELREHEHAVDPAFEVELLSVLAGFEFYLAQYETAEQRLQKARNLAALVPRHGIEAATIEWIQALLFRLRGQPELALRPAAAAAEVYMDRGSPASAARIQTVLAGIGLDLAERFSRGTDRGAFITLAQPHVQLAADLAHEAGDEIGAALARLAGVRFSRLNGHNEDRVATIEQIIQLASRISDQALVAQGWTALGDELAAQGKTEQGLTSYRTVLAVLEGSDIPTLGVEARRALLRSGEMTPVD